MKRLIASALVLVACMLVAFPPAALAAPSAPQDELMRWSYIHSVTASIDIASDGRASAYGSSSLQDWNDKVEIVVELQKKVNGGWETVKPWAASGTGYAVAYGDWYVYSGNIYRTLTTANAYHNGYWVEVASIASSEFVY